MNIPLYERIGGEATVEAAVNSFYQHFLQEKRIEKFFVDVDLQLQKQRLRHFFKLLLGGCYDIPRDRFVAIHVPLLKKGLEASDVYLWLSLTRKTLLELEIPDVLVEEFLEMCEPYKQTILSLLDTRRAYDQPKKNHS